jgi:hypothetical protein
VSTTNTLVSPGQFRARYMVWVSTVLKTLFRPLDHLLFCWERVVLSLSKHTYLLSHKLPMHPVCYVKRCLLYGGVNFAAWKAILYVSPSATIRRRRDKNKPKSMNLNVGQSYLFRFKCSKNVNRLSHAFLHESMPYVL